MQHSKDVIPFLTRKIMKRFQRALSSVLGLEGVRVDVVPKSLPKVTSIVDDVHKFVPFETLFGTGV